MPLKRAVLLLTTLMLAACGQQTSLNGPQPSGAQNQTSTQLGKGALYEITFQGVGGPHPSSTAAVLGKSALGTQTLSDVSTGSLAFTPLVVDTFRTGNTRHIRAVYRVTNNTAAPIGHLTFVPVDTDEDSDAATTTTTTPTVGSTYFKDLTTFGATDASGRAGDLTPTTGKMLGAQGAVAFDPASTPYVALDTSSLSPAAPAGLVVASRASAGWRASTPLDVGDSTTIAFAVDLANSSPQTDPFSFSVVVTEADDPVPNVTVYQVGDGRQQLFTSAAPVLLKTFRGDVPNQSTPVSTVSLPIVSNGADQPLTASGNGFFEGFLNRSADGRYLLVPGYATVPGYPNVATSTAVTRVVGRVDAAGTTDTSTTTTAFSGASIRGVASPDGSRFYMVGGTGGVQLEPLGESASQSVVSGGPTDLFQTGIFAGQLYATFNDSTGRVSFVQVGSGLPLGGGRSYTALPGVPASINTDFSGFFFADLSPSVAGLDTLYFTAIGGSEIQKYTFDGTRWRLNGRFTLNQRGSFGLTGYAYGSNVLLYSTSANTLITLTDSSGYNAPINGRVVTLATAPANTDFRGVTLALEPLPLP
ncbi:hypothetical protein [Deinococcus altitudinis]|uniref:hypothetical protein n=1 Tax=Deinococcus altitudinis TaxID=468914 RepID=UPI0038928CB8